MQLKSKKSRFYRLKFFLKFYYENKLPVYDKKSIHLDFYRYMYINYPKYNYNYQLDGIYFNIFADQKQKVQKQAMKLGEY